MRPARLQRSSGQPNAPTLHPTMHVRSEPTNQTRPRGRRRPLDLDPYRSTDDLAAVLRLRIWPRDCESGDPESGRRDEAARADEPARFFSSQKEKHELATFYWSRAPEIGRSRHPHASNGTTEGVVGPAVDRGSVLLRAVAAARSGANEPTRNRTIGLTVAGIDLCLESDSAWSNRRRLYVRGRHWV